ncbi:MAG: hypothetical protein P8L18_04135 [Verrucomicrobiota bacterium]|nr:hypothetical protein [Verrucomicrobiota bacterium]
MTDALTRCNAGHERVVRIYSLGRNMMDIAGQDSTEKDSGDISQHYTKK